MVSNDVSFPMTMGRVSSVSFACVYWVAEWDPHFSSRSHRDRHQLHLPIGFCGRFQML